MHLRKYTYLLMIVTGAFILASAFLLWPTTQASAQCGSQASSCKNCHEVQGQDPVNNDGTGWHQSHAFGDFCYLCHAGNNQSMVPEEAHAGMVAPLSDVQAACASCHPADLMERAQVYATALGVTVGEGGGSSAAPPASSGSSDQPAPSTASEPVVVPSTGGEVVDYTQRYNETALGQRNINWGNAILVMLIAVVAVGGGAFVYWNERRLRGTAPAKAKTQPAATQVVPQVEGYSPEVAALLPMIAQLNPVGLHSLRRLLQNPEQANEILHSLANLDPELLRRVRTLDPDARSLLLAVAGD
jgi:cytochrome c553